MAGAMPGANRMPVSTPDRVGASTAPVSGPATWSSRPVHSTSTQPSGTIRYTRGSPGPVLLAHTQATEPRSAARGAHSR